MNKGLEARKEARAASERAEKYRDAARSERDDRWHDHCNHRSDARKWAEEKEGLERIIIAQRSSINKLTTERDALLQKERETNHHHIIGGAAKAIAASVLLVFARDLGLMALWLANSLMGISVAYLLYTIIKLMRKK